MPLTKPHNVVLESDIIERNAEGSNAGERIERMTRRRRLARRGNPTSRDAVWPIVAGFPQSFVHETLGERLFVVEISRTPSVLFLNGFYHHAERKQGFPLMCAVLEFP